MKQFAQSLSQVVVNLCISFTIAVLIYAAFSQGTLPQGMVWQLLLLSAAATLLQFAFFSGKVVKRLSYLWRMVLFAALMLAVVSACAVGFGWFPVADARSWLFFVGLFLVLFAAISLAFEVGFRLRRRVYDDALGRYKKGRAE